MKSLRKRFEVFCFRHRSWGIPNLMLYVSLATALVYVLCLMDQRQLAYYMLCFDRTAILQGQVWRLFTYPLVYGSSGIAFGASNPILIAISLLCYFSIGKAIENVWGTLRFNLFYLTGILMMDIYCMIFGGRADVYYLNMSLFLAYATMYPDAHFLLLFIIPVKAWIFALLDLLAVLIGLFQYPFTVHNLFPVIALANYFLFFGKDVVNVFPISWRANLRRLFRKRKHAAAQQPKPKPKTIPIPTAGSYQASTASAKAPYTHRCTVCGKTDVSDPELEFRYCSRCNGYYCYCQEHISNHTHVQ